MKKNAYDLARNLIEVMADIDRALDQKSKSKNMKEIEALDTRIDSLETRMYEIKNKLKSVEVK
ncbi:hypothetical protein [Clostridium sp. BJN0001]|uniref:hypothetical protein n=1 Tax=Clostridium sp. BJN0001 TaxID=2930219 RepID=UPI001FD60B7B|nr:hypothetical protein [Clostridium sp. BJN0001]